MNIDELKEQVILFFGKSRALDIVELEIQLKAHNVKLVDEYDASVSIIIEGRMINPIQQIELDRIYEEDSVRIIGINELEELISKSIENDKLLMSLKLSNNQERLLGYLGNKYIDDELFLRLLNLYDWRDEGFFESDENRNVTASLIERFYDNIERNHNVQYANIGIMHLLTQSNNIKLIETIGSLSPIQKALKEECDSSTYKILREIAIHKQTPSKIQKQFVKYGDNELRSIIALRQDTTVILQEQLLNLNEEVITLTLASNMNLNNIVAEKLYLDIKYHRFLASNKQMSDYWFDHFIDTSVEALSTNETLNLDMQQKLFDIGSEGVWISLASNNSLLISDKLKNINSIKVNKILAKNENIPKEILESLYELGGVDHELASNIKTPKIILAKLGDTNDITMLSILAQNSSTPIELLYQFQLDQRLERYVMSNSSFGEHIQTTNIGWL